MKVDPWPSLNYIFKSAVFSALDFLPDAMIYMVANAHIYDEVRYILLHFIFTSVIFQSPKGRAIVQQYTF